MKCEICHKNDATTAYTHIVDDTKKTLLLCGNLHSSKRGKEKRRFPPERRSSFPECAAANKKVKVEFNTAGSSEATENTVCRECGMTYKAVQERLDVWDVIRCYTSFAPQLERLLKRIHGADAHCGKDLVEVGTVPSPHKALEQLRSELKDAVGREQFERAAQIRDQIRGIEADAEGDLALNISELAANHAQWLNGAEDHHGVVVSCRARLARNLSAMPFAPKATVDDQERVIEQVLTAAQRGTSYA